MTHRLRIFREAAFAASVLALVGCQTNERFVLEREFPFELGEPVYLLKPSDFPMSDVFAVWVPRQPPPTKAAPVVTINAIGPNDTTPPVLTQASRDSLREIVREMPSYLPKRAIFLISSQGAVVEVALTRARDKLNERLFAARLRAIAFQAATSAGKPIAVICEVDLVTGLVGPGKSSASSAVAVPGARATGK